MMTAGQKVKNASRPGPIGFGLGSLSSPSVGREHDREQRTGTENKQRKPDPEQVSERKSWWRIHARRLAATGDVVVAANSGRSYDALRNPSPPPRRSLRMASVRAMENSRVPRLKAGPASGIM